jgi:hypothetical protein
MVNGADRKAAPVDRIRHLPFSIYHLPSP